MIVLKKMKSQSVGLPESAGRGSPGAKIESRWDFLSSAFTYQLV